MAQKSSGEMAYEALLAAIRAGVYLPGDRLREEDVGERLNLSRTPVRDVLRQLAGEGYLKLEENRGAKVSSMAWDAVLPERIGVWSNTLRVTILLLPRLLSHGRDPVCASDQLFCLLHMEHFN